MVGTVLLERPEDGRHVKLHAEFQMQDLDLEDLNVLGSRTVSWLGCPSFRSASKVAATCRMSTASRPLVSQPAHQDTSPVMYFSLLLQEHETAYRPVSKLRQKRVLSASLHHIPDGGQVR